MIQYLFGKRLLALMFLATVILTGCKEEEEDEPIAVSFETSSIDVNESDTVTVTLALKEPAKKKEYVTFSVTPGSAEFGVDFGIDNILALNDVFTIAIPKDSSSVSFSFIALADFKNESPEEVEFEINDLSEGLIPGDPDAVSVTINNIANNEVSNRTLIFDGIDDFIDLGNIYDNLALPVTISAWIWLDPTAPSGLIPIFDSQDGLPSYNGFNFLTSTSSVVGVQYGDGLGENNSAFRRAKSASFEPVMGRWVNFTAVMRSATDMSLYFNGVDVGGAYAGESNLPMKSNSPTEVAKIGYLSQNGAVYRFKGKMDELKIWNKSLTAQEIQTVIFKKLNENEPGLIGYWNFDEPTGEAALDLSKNHFNGVIKGTPVRVLSEVPVR